MKNSYPWGIDWIWMGTDRCGSVAAFITSGEGPVPISLLENNEFGHAGFEDYIDSLPAVSGADVKVNVPRPDSFINIASKGVFVYDWGEFYHNPIGNRHSYRLVAEPVNPIGIGALSVDVRNALSNTPFADILFGESMTINPDDIFDCAMGFE